MESLAGEIPFDWNSSFRLIDLTNAIARLRLPSFSARGHVTFTANNTTNGQWGGGGGEWGGEWGVEDAVETKEKGASIPPTFDYASLG